MRSQQEDKAARRLIIIDVGHNAAAMKKGSVDVAGCRHCRFVAFMRASEGDRGEREKSSWDSKSRQIVIGAPQKLRQKSFSVLG